MITFYDIILWSSGFLGGVGVTLSVLLFLARRPRPKLLLSARTISAREDDTAELSKDFHA